MPAKWHKYSYSAQIEERRAYTTVLVFVIVLLVVFNLVNANLVTFFSIRSDAMEPTLSAHDAIVTTPLYDSRQTKRDGLSLFLPSSRGDIVVLTPAYSDPPSLPVRFFRILVSFVTFQRIRPFQEGVYPGEQPAIRRLLAYPGDSLYMKDFTLYVRPAGSTHFLSEYELVDVSYDIKQDSLPEGWGEDFPFSASFGEITLGEDEYFVLCDNRRITSDSRVWGPLPSARIRGRAVLRYWPFAGFGAL